MTLLLRAAPAAVSHARVADPATVRVFEVAADPATLRGSEPLGRGRRRLALAV